jgi:ATP-dependent DNA helicase RecQ
MTRFAWPWRAQEPEEPEAAGLQRASRDEALVLLRRALDDPAAEFRDGQWEAIDALVSRQARLLVVQRTGWGKSLVYFLATRLLRQRGAGPTLLVSPLIALMRNQIEAAERLGVHAATMNSSNHADWQVVRSSLRDGDVDVLLISPERLADTKFREEVLLPEIPRIGLFVVDEAHCISDWGHDFRPDYRRIVRILQLLPRNVPMLATTATANDRVVEDVLDTLGSQVQLLRGPLVRESLRLQTISLPSQAARMAWIAEWLPQLSGTGIIYALTVRDTQQLAAWLRSQGIDAHAYWGGLESSTRQSLELRLLRNDIKAIVATTALGMGFDKPDLGFVIHFQRPGSVIHYYQQVGRAGRAIEESYGILLGGQEDDEISDYFIRTAFPPEAHVAEVLGALRAADDGLSLTMIERQVNLHRGQIEKVLKSLAVRIPAPVGIQGTRWFANPVRYQPDIEKIQRLTAIRRTEQARMIEYMQNRKCLMMFLAEELDDPTATQCGRCAVCRGEALIPATYPEHLKTSAVQFLRKNDQTIQPRRRWPQDALSGYGWNGAITPEQSHKVGRALCVWGDDGWGESVRRGKQHDGRFEEALVFAVVEMVRSRWAPQPPPTWVTCIPSLRQPKLVPEFAQRVAGLLRLPFVPAVRKLRVSEPQKLMQNSFTQAHNLENSFQVSSWEGIGGGVLLLDDMVDSGWTFTVVAALLRDAGSGPVFPLALAVASQAGN